MPPLKTRVHSRGHPQSKPSIEQIPLKLGAEKNENKETKARIDGPKERLARGDEGRSGGRVGRVGDTVRRLGR